MFTLQMCNILSIKIRRILKGIFGRDIWIPNFSLIDINNAIHVGKFLSLRLGYPEAKVQLIVFFFKAYEYNTYMFRKKVEIKYRDTQQ